MDRTKRMFDLEGVLLGVTNKLTQKPPPSFDVKYPVWCFAEGIQFDIVTESDFFY